jgi:tRNA(Ile)-lysidine synthase
MGLPERFARHLDASRLLDGAPCVVVACSGGGDSVALLALLADWAAPRGLPVVAAHVAHGLRGEAGERDALLASRLAAFLGVPCALRPVDVKGRRRRGESLEAAARRERYATLLALAAEIGPGTRVATGHTADDQAETVLLNLHRHAGRTRGGIRAHRADGVVRPLLPFRRAELRAFLSSREIAWREDETNENEALLRNRIRRREIPELEAASPGTATRLARAGEAWSARIAGLDERIDGALAGAGAPLEGPWPRLLVVSLGEEAAGRLLLRAAGAAGAVPGRRQVEKAVRRIFRGDAPLSESLAGRRLSADSRVVRLARRGPARPVSPDRLES